jgi:pilus assembly protein CpaE
MSAHSSPTVRVACADPILLDEVIRHLEEIPHWRLSASAHSITELLNGVPPQADFLILSDALATELAGNPRAPSVSGGVIVFGREERSHSLRAALKLGARDFVLWPEDQLRIREIIESQSASVTTNRRAPSGALNAVWAPKGGSGASVVAAHLAAAMATLGPKCVVMDLDLAHSDQTAILGAEAEQKSIIDLLRVAQELSAPMVDSVAWEHSDGFRAILAPGSGREWGSVESDDVMRVIATVRETADQVVADLASGISELVMRVLLEASTVLMVLTPDLLSLRRARDAFAVLRAAGVDPARFLGVLNQAGGADISEKDVRSVLGLTTTFRVKADMQVYRAANRGELSLAGKRMLAPVARMLSETISSGPPSAILTSTVGREREVKVLSAPELPPREPRTPAPVSRRSSKSASPEKAPGVVRVMGSSSRWRS